MMENHSADKPFELDLADGGHLLYEPHLWPEVEAVRLYTMLRDHIPWEQRSINGWPEKRLTMWIGEFEYTYSGILRPAVQWNGDTLVIRRKVEKFVFGKSEDQFQGVLLNYYRDGNDKLGSHADDEETIKPNSPIASVSFGAVRKFVLRHRGNGQKLSLELGHGSCLVMSGTTQLFWKHEVPLETRIKEGRINLTFRQYLTQSSD